MNIISMESIRSRVTAGLLLGLAISIIAGASTVFAQDSVVTEGEVPIPERIAGDVIQSSAGATVPNGLEVTLTTFDTSNIPVGETSVAVGVDGAFEFTDFPKREGYRYELVTLYGNLQQTVKVEDALDPESIGLRIYETTASLENISATTHVTIIPRVDGKDQLMGVLELVEISNGGDRTFVADLQNPAPDGIPQLLRFSLPVGYKELTVDADLPSGNVLEIETGFAMSNAVPPGDFRVLYSYVLEYDGSGTIFDRSLAYDVFEYRILMPPAYGNVFSDGFEATGDELLGDTNYRVFQRDGLSKDDRIQINFTDLPEPSGLQSFQNFVGGSAWATIGTPLVAAAAMAILLGYVFFYRNRRRPGDAATGISREQLIKEIAELDSLHESGEINDEEYAEERMELFDMAIDAPDHVEGESGESESMDKEDDKDKDIL
ncbi:MAG: hypothetical protein HQ478_16155 [Chloroflexi bacterium]|nr:hypothetical protein [Chloroflexota bacterium]